MILICIIINLTTIKNEGEKIVWEEGKWWGCHDGEVKEEGRRVGGVEKLRKIKWSFTKTW